MSRSDLTFGAIVAAISGIVGLLSSLVTLWSQASDVVAKAARLDFAPVGTVISSMLSPTDFAVATGEVEGAALEKRKWVVADGRKVTGTKYGEITHDAPLPDLRNTFIRGADPTGQKNQRKAGDSEGSATKLPNRPFDAAAKVVLSFTVPSYAPGTGDRYNAGGKDYIVPYQHNYDYRIDQEYPVLFTGGGDSETRPENVALYLYIKIN